MARSSVLGDAVHVEPEAIDRAVAAELRNAGDRTDGFALRLPDGREVTLTEALARLLLASAGELAEGHAVTVLASDSLLTPADAGRLLGLSRPFVARLLDDAEIPSQHLPGSRHRVVRLTDVLEFQARRERRREGRHRINDAIDDADLPY